MKQTWKLYFIVLAGVLVLSLNLPAVASENLDDWDESIGQGNISLIAEGTILNVTANGSSGEVTGARYKNFANNVGLLVTVNVTNVSGRTQIGIRKNVGRTPVAFGFVFSQEFLNMGTSNEQYLDVLYHAFFNRDPDQGGFDDWLNQLKSETSREDVLRGFIYAQEFYNLCNEYGITPN